MQSKIISQQQQQQQHVQTSLERPINGQCSDANEAKNSSSLNKSEFIADNGLKQDKVNTAQEMFTSMPSLANGQLSTPPFKPQIPKSDTLRPRGALSNHNYRKLWSTLSLSKECKEPSNRTLVINDNNNSCNSLRARSISSPMLNQPIMNYMEEDETSRIRDVCSKYFTRDNGNGARPVLIASNLPSHNLKSSSYITEKITPKETIVDNIPSCTTRAIISNQVISNSYNPGHRFVEVRRSGPTEITNKPANTEYTGVSDQHVVVVSCFENTDKNLKVKGETNGKDFNGLRASSSPELNYKSSSESGRGTMRSEVNSNSTPLEHSHDSDQSATKDEKHSTTANIIEKMQLELQRILDDGDVTSDVEKGNLRSLPVVQESDSWVSDSTSPIKDVKIDQESVKKNYKQEKISESTSRQNKPIFRQTKVKPRSNTSLNSTVAQNQPPVNSTISTPSTPNNKVTTYKKSGIKNRKWTHSIEDIASTTTGGIESIVDYGDDITSEYTANTSNWDIHHRQLPKLELMYSQILSLLTSRMKNAKKYALEKKSSKLRRRLSGSLSSMTGISSLASRDVFRRSSKYFHDNYAHNKGSRRLKRLEGYIMTLARSVAQLSSEIRVNHTLIKDIETLRSELDQMKEQLKSCRLTSSKEVNSLRKNSPLICDPKEIEKYRSEILGGPTNKLDKLKRFFGDDPPLLRQFLKKLGYEKYACKFESEKIGLKELIFLNEEKLQKLGIPMGPRIRIIQELSKLKPSNCNVYLV